MLWFYQTIMYVVSKKRNKISVGVFVVYSTLFSRVLHVPYLLILVVKSRYRCLRLLTCMNAKILAYSCKAVHMAFPYFTFIDVRGLHTTHGATVQPLSDAPLHPQVAVLKRSQLWVL